MISSDGLEQLSKALKDPLKKKVIAKDETIIGALVLVLSNSDKKVVIEALNVLLSLATPVENRPFLYEFIGMVDQLTLLANDKNPLDHIRELSSQLLQRLRSEHHVTVAPQQPQQLKRDSNAVASSNRFTAKTFNKPFLNAGRCKTITLQIEGLHDKSDMETCRERLLAVKGVVSITFDLSKHRSIIRVKPEVTPQMLANAIYQTNTMIAKQVIRAESGDEKVLDLHEETGNQENPALPAYLSDDDSPMKVDDKAVRRFGYQEEAREGGWLGAAANFLAKSFYW